MKNYVYVELQDRVQLKSPNVRICDIASVYVANATLWSQVKNTIVFRLLPNGEKTQVISLLYVTKVIISHFPDCIVIPHGEADCVLEFESVSKTKWKHLLQEGKVFLVSLLCFFGGAFSIMSFHNDISITNIFTSFYELVTGTPSSGCTILEISYSFGLMAGIIIFYNHVGKKKILPQPTPIEVSMRNYERDKDETVVKMWEREGKKTDVD